MDDGPELYFVVAYNDTDPRKPPELMRVPDEFYPLLGRIIINWGILEQEMELLISAVAAANGSSNPGWLKLQFNRRWAYLRDEWATFAAGNAELVSEMKGVASDIDRAKYLRDCIAHKRISAGTTPKGNHLRFQNENKTYPWTKRFFLNDLITASLAITSASGRLFRLTNLEHAQFLSPQSKSLLQRLPDMGHLRFPIPKGAYRRATVSASD